VGEYKVSRPHSAGHEKEAKVLGAKAVTKNSMQEPGYVQRPKLASASHPIKENNTGLPKMALPKKRLPEKRLPEKRLPEKRLPEKRLPGNLHDAHYPGA
jgi:hypothetical protein